MSTLSLAVKELYILIPSWAPYAESGCDLLKASEVLDPKIMTHCPTLLMHGLHTESTTTIQSPPRWQVPIGFCDLL